MGYGRILYYERYDGLGVLIYPFEPFNLAVVWSGKKIFVRPIIELLEGDCYFLYQGRKINPFVFELRPDVADPDWALDWVDYISRTNKIDIDINNLTEECKADFNAMLDRKTEKLQEWLLAR